MIAIRKCFTKMHLLFGRLLPFLQQTFGNIAQAEMEKKQFSKWGNGCSSFGREVIFDTRDQQFESSHRQFFIAINCIEKTKKRKKKPGMGQIENTNFIMQFKIISAVTTTHDSHS